MAMSGHQLTSTSQDTDSSAELDVRAVANRLFASPTLVDLLGVFCREPDGRFYVNELIRRTGHFPRSIQLGLATLERTGFITSERVANIRYYRVVREHLLYSDLSSMMRKVFDVPTVLARAFRLVPGIRAAFLRPADPESSSLELVIIAADAVRAVTASALDSLAPSLASTIRPTYFSPEEWSRQARRDRSYVRWLLDDSRTYVVGGDKDLPAL